MLKADSDDLDHIFHRLDRHRNLRSSPRKGQGRGGRHRGLRDWLCSAFKKERHSRHQPHPRPCPCPHGDIPAQNFSAEPAYCIIPEKCHGCGRCKSVCRMGAISGSNKQAHTIDPAKCMRCGHCLEVCKHGAIRAIT